MSSPSRPLTQPSKLARKRLAPRPQGDVETRVPKLGAFVVRHTFSHRSGLDFPDLPVFHSMGPGTCEYNGAPIITPIDPPSLDLVHTLTLTQRKLVAEFRHAESDFGGPLRSPRMTEAIGPQTARPMPNALISTGALRSMRRSSPQSARETGTLGTPDCTSTGEASNIRLPSLFGGGRTKAQHRHLQAVKKNGEKFKGPGPAPPSRQGQQSSSSLPQPSGSGSPVGLPPAAPHEASSFKAGRIGSRNGSITAISANRSPSNTAVTVGENHGRLGAPSHSVKRSTTTTTLSVPGSVGSPLSGETPLASATPIANDSEGVNSNWSIEE